MIGDWRIEGHAIVSADDRIAGPDGSIPAALQNEADWVRFQAALDAASVVVLGRLSHEATPNVRRRNRLIVSGSVAGVERRADGWWWNPAYAPAAAALAAAAPSGGIAAVPGGHLVFDLFRELGFDAFHLARNQRVRLPGGIPLFSAIDAGGLSADAILDRDGLAAGPVEMIDPSAGVSLTVWRRPGAA